MAEQTEIRHIESPRNIDICAMKISQPIGTFYSAKIKAKELYEIAKFDIRRITQREGIDDFLGIQREVSGKRLVELKQYIRTQDATFPTAVIVAIDERCALFTELSTGSCFGMLTLSNFLDPENPDNDILFRDIAKIIDGQHRLKAFEDGVDNDFEINLAVFVGADIATQTEVFSTVNLAQTKVNRSLVLDLFSVAKTRSPEKTAHEITVLLDRKPESPFHLRIKRLGVATEGRFGETLSQATIVRGILSHLTKSAVIDREIGKRKLIWNFSTGDHVRFVFRYHFIKGQDDHIFVNIFNYFSAVRDVWPTAWNRTGLGNVLPRTNGYLAFMRFLRPAVLEFSVEPTIVSQDHFRGIFNKIKTELNDDSFNTSNFPPGTSGETRLYNELVRISGVRSIQTSLL